MNKKNKVDKEKKVIDTKISDAPKSLAKCCCDYSAFCPVHSKNGRPAYKIDQNSYIAQS